MLVFRRSRNNVATTVIVTVGEILRIGNTDRSLAVYVKDPQTCAFSDRFDESCDCGRIGSAIVFIFARLATPLASEVQGPWRFFRLVLIRFSAFLFVETFMNLTGLPSTSFSSLYALPRLYRMLAMCLCITAVVGWTAPAAA